MSPATHKYAKLLYEGLLAHSENGKFTGKLTDIWNSVGASQTFYSKVRKLLLDEGCITVVERGSRNVPSVIVLNHPPPDAPPEAEREAANPHLTRAATLARVEGRVKALEGWRESTGGINIAEALRNFEKRLSRVEAETGVANGKVKKQATPSKTKQH